MKPLFSIVIPTRNRFDTCIKAVNSVLDQSEDDVELIVVDDGSNSENFIKLTEFSQQYSSKINLFQLCSLETGHGVSTARNFGINQCRGRFVGMLDDDDIWTDPDFLKKTRSILSQYPETDLVLANQRAIQDGNYLTQPVWIESLERNLRKGGQTPDMMNSLNAPLKQLLSIGGFCHLNCMITRRTLLRDVGGFDPCLRYESDRDLYLRLIDSATSIRHLIDTVALHYVPNQNETLNVSTRVDRLEKLLFQARIMQKLTFWGKTPDIRKYGNKHLCIVYKHITEALVQAGNIRQAVTYSRYALATQFSVKWYAYSSYIKLKSLLNA